MSARVPLRLPTAVACLILLSSGCARRIAYPTGPTKPFPGALDAYAEATAECRNVRTITATLSLSGRAGETKLRGRVDAGFAAPARMRLEGRAPFGRAVFIMVARGDTATLVLPRDNRVLKDAPPAAIVEALAGVPLAPDDLRALVSGCGLAGPPPSSGVTYGNENWASVESGTGLLMLNRRDGRWRVIMASRPPVVAEYDNFVSGRPTTIRLRATARADITVKLSDVAINVDLGDDVFDEKVPPDAEPLTLNELRRAGPLGGGN